MWYAQLHCLGQKKKGTECVLSTHLGISLYTYHKYRKSIDSKVALDPHGNPIIDPEEGLADGDVALRNGSQANFEDQDQQQLLDPASSPDLSTNLPLSEIHQVGARALLIILSFKYVPLLTRGSITERSNGERLIP